MQREEPPADRGDPKEAQILAAAREAFLELGYAATSMDLVAQRARASKTTLYTRFPSKETLFAAMINAECERLGMRFDPDALAALPVEAALTRIGQAFVALIWAPGTVRMERIVTGEASRFPEIAAIFHREGPERVRNAVAAYFAAAAARGQILCDDPHFVAGQFLVALKGTAHCELMLGVGAAPSDPAAFVAQVIRMLLDGLRPRS